jgi:hypothetical protein
VGAPVTIHLPDGRSLDASISGPEDGTAVVLFNGTPSSGLQSAAQVRAAGERGLGSSPGAAPGTATRPASRAGFDGMVDDDIAFTRPWGCELDAIPGTVHVWQGGHDRMVPYTHGEWLLANLAGAGCAHLLPEHGHLSLAVDGFPAILDELVRPAH